MCNCACVFALCIVTALVGSISQCGVCNGHGCQLEGRDHVYMSILAR